MNIIKKIKQLDNKLFNNNIIKNNDTNYIIGFIVATISAAILQDYFKPSYIMTCNITKILFLIIILSIARHNFTLAIILSILYTCLSFKSKNKNVENFTFYDADNDDDDDDDDKPHPDEDPELEKLRKQALESEDNDQIIDVDSEDDDFNDNDSNSDTDTSKDIGTKKENKCLINCLKDKRNVDECKHICENICDCGILDKSVKESKESDLSDDIKQTSVKIDKESKDESQTEISKDKDSEKDTKKSGKEENNLDRLRRILNDDN